MKQVYNNTVKWRVLKIWNGSSWIKRPNKSSEANKMINVWGVNKNKGKKMF